MAEQYDKTGTTTGVADNLILLTAVSTKESFLFKFAYSSREGLYFFNGTGLQTVLSPYLIENYMELVYQNSGIYICEKGAAMSYRYKKL